MHAFLIIFVDTVLSLLASIRNMNAHFCHRSATQVK